MNRETFKHLAVSILLAASVLCGCDKGGTHQDAFKETVLEPLSGSSLRIASHNMLFEKEVPNVESHKWVNRLKAITDLYSRCPVDIIGSQEILGWQGKEFMEALGYAASGVNQSGAPEDSDKADKSEYERIFYRPERFEVLEEDHFWYSETPDKPGSYSWDATHTRSCCYARFREKSTGKEFYVFNSHFHVDAPLSRLNSAKILLGKISSIDESLPVICTGDLNDIIDSESLTLLLSSGKVKDSRKEAKSEVYGPVGSSHGFNTAKIPVRRIDHVLVNDHVRVKSYRIVDDELKTGKFCSDHLPVFVDIELQ